MAFTEGQLAAYYGGNSHACVRLPMPPPFTQPEVRVCGRIVPPPAQTFDVVGPAGDLNACVRTANLEVQCGYVEKLYTPNIFVDNWGWFVIVAVVIFLIYRYQTTKEYRQLAAQAEETERLANIERLRLQRINDPVILQKLGISKRLAIIAIVFLIFIIVVIVLQFVSGVYNT